MNPNPKISDYSHFDGVDEYDRQLNADLFRELREIRAEINKRVAGTYLPSGTVGTPTNLSAATFYRCQYSRTQNVGTVSGKIDVTAAGLGLVQFSFPLPISSNITAQEHCCGTGVVGGVAGVSAAISGDTVNHTALFSVTPADTSAHSFFFILAYQIL